MTTQIKGHHCSFFYVTGIMKITINTPKWIDSVYRTASYAKRSLMWVIKPPRCKSCGTRMHTNSYDVECAWDDAHERMMVANLNGDLVCPQCLVKELDASAASKDGIFGKLPVNRNCDCCHEPSTTYNIYTTDRMRLHFCLNWWNGFYICKPCIRRTLTCGTVRTSMVGYFKGKYTSIGANGLYLKAGKVQLFKWIKS